MAEEKDKKPESPAEKAPQPKKSSKYKVVHPVKHGVGKEEARHYERGETIELSDKHAEPLVKSGVVRPFESEE